MASVNRQNNLFAAEDWKVAYKAFSKVDFQAYDFDTIRSALVDYIKINFPENFNDYTESSEFIAIIEMLAFLSQSLAFRMDLNSRENFLETAERRDSVFKLARMLGYNPRRNICASGLLKVDAVRTTEPLRDSVGNDLNNTTVYFDDANNADSYEQFITILNGAMNKQNRFTVPVIEGEVNGINSEIYEITTPATSPVAYNFDLKINGATKKFQAVNPTFKDGGVFEEQHPDIANNFNLIYRNDGLGVSSNDTGFFLMFKQGELNTSNFSYITPVESRIEDVLISNINETDVFLQEIDASGNILNKWSKVPNTVGQTLTYNDLSLDTRNLYSVENLDNNGIRIKYPDGTFGNIPFGNFRLYTRSSDPNNFTITPDDARSISVTIPYQNGKGQEYKLTLICSLKYQVSNSLPSESLTAVKTRAPQAFYTQNRMVSAQDYQVFPFSQSTNITKLKAINKTHAGHSRFIDINDPTGTYQNLDTFAQDGALYSELKTATNTIRVTDNNTIAEVLQYDIPQLIKNQNLNNFSYNEMREVWTDLTTNKFSLKEKDIKWKTLPVTTGKSSTGYFVEKATSSNESILRNDHTSFMMFQENNFLRFENPVDPSQWTWARITRIDNNGLLSSGLSTSQGSFTMSDKIQHDWKITEYISTVRKEFNTVEKTNITDELENKRTFGLGFDTAKDSWYVISNANLDKKGKWNPLYAKNTQEQSLDATWLILFEFSAQSNGTSTWNATLRGQQYFVESKNDLKFYNILNAKVADSENSASQDKISFTRLNFKPGSSEVFTWLDTDDDGSGDSFKGDVFRSDLTGELYTPSGYQTNIPLRSRNTKWFDVSLDWKTNLGIYREADATANVFVDQARVNLQAYFKTDNSGANAQYANVTLSNNSGIINFWPGQVDFEFNNTTFGYNILQADGQGNPQIVYRDYNDGTDTYEVYRANVAGGTSTTISYGINNNAANTSALGRVDLVDANLITQTGNIRIKNWNLNGHTYVRDSVGLSQDEIIVTYDYDSDKLDREIDWTIISPVKYNDGFTDNKKVVVKPLDSDNDLVPDYPLQFRDFVARKDLIFFDYYTDFDGYKYSRPFTGSIMDWRNESVLIVKFNEETISPGSYNSERSLSEIDLIILKNDDLVANFENNSGKFGGKILYSVETEKVFRLTPQSTSAGANSVVAVELGEEDFYVRNGRATGQNTAEQSNDEIIFKWKHVAPKDVRIDPSISNVVEMLVLSSSYYLDIKKYQDVPGTEFPYPPTSSQLANEFSGLNEFKSASDTLVFKSAKFKRLFGADADSEVQAKFRVVKLKGSTLSDNEIKSRIIKAFNTYFNIENWEFGETFYFTELSSYVHQVLGSNIGSIVIIPKNNAGKFGDLFQVKAEPDELFLHTAKVTDIEVVDKISSQTLRTDR